MSLASIVNVEITRQTQSVSQQGFGTLMLLGTHKRFNNRIRYYTNMREVEVDFRPFDVEYVAAQDVFSQSPAPALLAIGRRTANDATIRVITSMTNQIYRTIINGSIVEINSTSSAQNSTITNSGPIVTLNVINVSLNGTQSGAIKSFVNFNTNFTSGDVISVTINGTPHANVASFTTDQATTMNLLGTNIVNLGVGITSFSVVSTNLLRLNFGANGDNTVDSVITVGGAAPTATITEGGFIYATSNAATMGVIAAQLAADLNTGFTPGVATATVTNSDLSIVLTSNPNQNAVLDYFVVKTYTGAAGVSSVITNSVQPTTNIQIANKMTAAINGQSLGVTADDSAGNGTFVISADVSGVPFTLSTSTNINNPNQAVVQVTQVEPRQAYTITINNQDFTYTTPNDVASAQEVAGALKDLINADLVLPVSADFDDVAQQSVVELDADLVTGNLIDITLNGVPLTQVAFVDSHDDTMQAIITLLQQQPGIQSAILAGPDNRIIQMIGFPNNNAVVNSFIVTMGASQATATITDLTQESGSLVIFQDNINLTFSIRVTPNILTLQKGLLIQPLTASDPVQDDLTAVEASSNDWYGVAITSRGTQDILSTAEWVQTRTKIFGTCSGEAAIIDQTVSEDFTSLAYQLFSNNYTRTFLIYHQDADDDYPECAWMGRCLPLEPGSETWKFKQLNTISYSSLSTTQSRNATSKNCNTYQFVGGFGITAEGVMASGEFIDIIRGIDWLTARIQEFVFFVLVNNNKVPYTDTGIAMIEAEVRRALDLGVTNNFLAEDPEYTVTVPRAATVPPNDKANRILRNVEFQATLAGAIHFVEIRGLVSV